jgi:hypothetical protein
MERDLGRDIDEFADHARSMETQDADDKVRALIQEYMTFIVPQKPNIRRQAPSFVRPPNVLLRDNDVPLDTHTAAP